MHSSQFRPSKTATAFVFFLLLVSGLSFLPLVKDASALTPGYVNVHSTACVEQYANNAPIFANGREWVFYGGGPSSQDVYVNSSLDGINFGGGHLVSVRGNCQVYSVFYSNTQGKFYYATTQFNGTSSRYVGYWGMGTLNADGSITMIVTDAIVNSGPTSFVGTPSIVLDGTGHLWISETDAQFARTVYVFHCSLTPSSCTSQTNWKLSLFQGGIPSGVTGQLTQLQTLTNNKVVLIFDINTVPSTTYINTWSGTSWDTANNSLTGLVPINAANPILGDCSSIHDTLQCSFPFSSITLGFVQAIYNTTSHHTVWQTPNSLFTLGGTSLGATIHTDNSSKISIVFNDRIGQVLHCAFSTNNGSSFSGDNIIGSGAGLGVATNQPGQATPVTMVAFDNDSAQGVRYKSLISCASGLHITVETNPVNLDVYVDGVHYSTTQSFTWAIGSMHNITAARLSGPSNIYGFGYWNNTVFTGQASRSQTVTASTSVETYVAFFYSVTLTANTTTPVIGHHVGLTATINQPIPAAGTNTSLSVFCPATVTHCSGGVTFNGHSTCFANSNDWVFYDDTGVTGSLQFNSSANGGASWPHTGIITPLTLATSSLTLAFYCNPNTNTFYSAVGNQTSGAVTIEYSSGTLTSGGTITYIVHNQLIVLNSSYSLVYPLSLVLDTNNHPWILAVAQISGSFFFDTFELVSGTWTERGPFIPASMVTGNIVSLNSGNVAILTPYTPSSRYTNLTVWTGSSWTDKRALSNYHSASINSVSFSATSIGNTIYLVSGISDISASHPAFLNVGKFVYPSGPWTNSTIHSVGALQGEVTPDVGSDQSAMLSVEYTALPSAGFGSSNACFSTDSASSWACQLLSSTELTALPVSVSPLIVGGVTSMAWAEYGTGTGNGEGNYLRFNGPGSIPLYIIGIFDSTNSTIVRECSSGLTCTASIVSHHIHTETYFAWVGGTSGPDSVINSTSLSITWDPPQINVTIRTNPVDLHNALTIDGVTYVDNPVTFSWAEGSMHNLSATTTNIGPGLVLYTFVSWSQGGSRVQTYTVGNSSVILTATYTSGAAPGTCRGLPPSTDIGNLEKLLNSGCDWGALFYYWFSIFGPWLLAILDFLPSLGVYLYTESPAAGAGIYVLVFICIVAGLSAASIPASLNTVAPGILGAIVAGSIFQLIRSGKAG